MKIHSLFTKTFSMAMLTVAVPAMSQRLAFKQSELKEWQFSKDQTAWQSVTIPHSCNALDGHSANYHRGKAYYKRTISLSGKELAQPAFLLFEGAAQAAEVTVNGQKVVRHEGGYTPFVVPLKGLLRQGDNEIGVMCDNKEDINLIPVSSDFNKNNGLHNPAYLLQMNTLYLCPISHGLYRLHVSTPTVNRQQAKALIETTIVNDAAKDRKYFVHTELIDASGRTVAEEQHTSLLQGGKSTLMTIPLKLQNPHLWDGLDDPYLYKVRISLYNKQGGQLQDVAETKVGFRFYEMTRHDGFYLNGRHYPLRGVSMHQDMDGRASAVLKENFDADYKTVQELGCNFLRLAHYPHNDYAFRLCDSLGLVVQTEIPWVNVCGVNAQQHYFDVIQKQMWEMITNLYNHPSICFWGMWNELDSWGNKDELQGKIDTRRVVSETGKLYDLARGLDPYRKIGLTDDSQFQREHYPQLRADYYSENRYNGWYNNVGKTGEFIKQLNKIHDLMGITNVAEYGAGVNPYCHSTETDEAYLRKDDTRHFEEYGNFIHETHLRQIIDMPFLNFTSLWILFDFPVANRLEGYYDSDDGVNFTENESRKYMNDKGLITRDRKTKKDVFYLYKAWWNKKVTTVHLTSTRLSYWPADKPIYVKVYSNAPQLTLYQDGRQVETKTSSGEKSGIIWTFGPLKFADGAKEATFKVTAPDGTSDQLTWKKR